MAAGITALYVPIVEYCSGQGRSTGEVAAFVEAQGGHRFHLTHVRNKLNLWADMGALRLGRGVPAEGGRVQALWYAAAKALDPLVLARVGVSEPPDGAALHPSAQPPRAAHLAVIREPIGADELFPEVPRSGIPQPKTPNPAGTLFTGQFRPDGVLITYEQFHYVVGLLEMMRQSYGQA